ncbi:tRNA (adenosine(37)-N6)-dimethylallyltransferase MiaA [Nemorincola caseinilytica]|uniref:tRNA dimethylallyltransferase n=1 Tax=Nemorincola caseinilytica TaxID=2054315 RepID=A0ABP8NA54_9BACT
MTTASKILYVIAGPTASGKTAAAIALAQRLDTCIISADSRQCYREMTIGTAKPTANELAAVKHYFIDEFPVTQELTAADFERLALGYLNEIFATRHTAVLCGGTGLYIKALCEGLDAMPATDPDIALRTEAEYKENGIEWLQQAVETEDPEFYETAEVQNPARLLRALSFIRSTGKSIVHYRSHTPKERPFRIIKIGLELPREVLYDRINRRVAMMMTEGLESEVRGLIPYKHLKNLQTVGYAELFEHFEGKCTLAEAVDKIKQHTRNYAKRQMTWFRKDAEMTWLRADDEQLVTKILAISTA